MMAGNKPKLAASSTYGVVHDCILGHIYVCVCVCVCVYIYIYIYIIYV